MKLYFKIVFIVVIILMGISVFLYIKNKRGRKYEILCKEIRAGDSIDVVLSTMGKPQKKYYYYSERLNKKLVVYSYPLPVLPSSNISVYIDSDDLVVAYTICNEP